MEAISICDRLAADKKDKCIKHKHQSDGVNQQRCGPSASVDNKSNEQTDDAKLIALLNGPVLTRLTIPSDANIYGNVHGGSILKLMEEAGTIAATRYCNNAKSKNSSDSREPCFAVLARIERMDFLLPMMIGEVAQLSTEIVFTSPHSLLVEISVEAEDIIKGVRRHTNQGRFWYVPLNDKTGVQPVPPMIYTGPEKEAAGRAAYEQQVAERARTSRIDLANNTPAVSFYKAPGEVIEVETVAYSLCCLSFLVGTNDATLSQYCRGGVLLKLMDECAGIVSAKHCRNNVVTACLHATNFHERIKIGSLVTVNGRLTFTSSRSLEVEVIVEFEVPFERGFVKQRAVDAFFTYVCIDRQGKALAVPPLKIKSEEEQTRFDEGQKRYEARRLQRSK